MSEGRSSRYDFAVLTHANTDANLFALAFTELRADYPDKGLLGAELFGRAMTGEVIVLFHFSFLAYSSALRARMEREAIRLKGKLLDPQLLPVDERERFYDRRLAAMDVRGELAGAPRPALEKFLSTFRAATPKEAPVPAAQPPLSIPYESADALALALRECIARGELTVPDSGAQVDQQVKLRFQVGGATELETGARVLSVDAAKRTAQVSVDGSAAVVEFLRRHGQRAREGRKALASVDERRATERFHTALQVGFPDLPSLSAEFVTNISQGGLFVKTELPPALREKVRLTLTLPDGSQVSTDAEVVHVVSVEDAQAKGHAAGVGLSFNRADDEFQGKISLLLANYRERRPRVLVVDDNAFFRTVLDDALAEAGMDVVCASNGEEALRVLVDRFYELDLITVDLNMPGLGGFGLIDRIRRVGGEKDLRVLVLSGQEPERLEALRGSGFVNAALEKSAPLQLVVDTIRQLLRDAPPRD